MLTILKSTIRLHCLFFVGLLQLCLHPVAIAQNQSYVFQHLNTENGLLTNEVKALCQDSKGYMWVGTTDGLQRYDGKRFVNYLADLQNPDALHQSWIKAIFEDSRHRLWIGSGAPYLFRQENNSFYNYNLHRPPGSPVIDGVNDFAEDRNGDIWLINQDSYYKLNSITNQFEDYGLLAGIKEGTKPGLLRKDAGGNIWFITTKGIRYYNPVEKKCYSKENNPKKLKILDTEGAVFSFCIEKENIWLGYNLSRVLYRYNFTDNSITGYPVKNIENSESLSKNIDVKIDAITFTSEKKPLFVLPGEGIAFFDPADHSFEEILLDNKDIYGLRGSPELFTAVTLYEDRDGNIWTGGDKGLNIFSHRKPLFSFYGTGNGEVSNTLPALNVNGMIQDKTSGDIYICYYFNTGGIIRLTKDLQYKKQYLYRLNGKTDIQENQIWCLFQDDDGVIWAPNQGKTILKLDTRTDRLSLVNDTTLYGNINRILKDGKGNKWLCTWKNGLQKIESGTGRISTFIKPPAGSSQVPKNIFSLCFDGDSTIWVGSNGSGFLKFDKRINQYTAQYLFDEKNSVSLRSNVIHRVIAWNKDTLLLATPAGLNFFNKRTGVFSALSAKDGLPGNIVTNIEVDKKRNIWLGCQGGFCKVNLNPLRIIRYGRSDGIIQNNIDIAPFLRTADGLYLVPLIKGFFTFNPDLITTAQAPPQPVITGFKLFDQYIKIDSFISNRRSIRLSYRQNGITIEFSSLQYNAPDKYKYFYKLEGVDDNWVLSSPEQAVYYHQLNNGHYAFKVKCTNRDGLESETSIPLSIIITPPFWKTVWFRMLLLLAVAGILFYFYRRRKESEKEKLGAKEKEMQLMKLNKDFATSQLTALRMQMNPHFIFNALNSIQQYVLQGNVTEANKYLSKFSKLQREILNCSNQSFISLEKEIELLNSYLQLEQLRFGKSFIYTIEINPEVDPSEIKIPPMILQPFVENAIWHGLMPLQSERLLTIRFDLHSDDILLGIIRDNGIGRTASARLKQHNVLVTSQHESKGMLMVNQRLKLLEMQYEKPFEVSVKDMADDNGSPTGTEVSLKIFIGTKHGQG